MSIKKVASIVLIFLLFIVNSIKPFLDQGYGVYVLFVNSATARLFYL